MSKKNIKTIQIAFNVDDPFQKQLYEYAKSEGENNISNFGKSLIKKDMLGAWKNREDERENAIELDEDSLQGFI